MRMNGVIPGNSWLLFSAAIIAVAAFISFIYQNRKLALAFLLLAGFLLRAYAAYLDPFLHDWDERFHAIVARNMMDNPLRPYLRLPVAPYDYKAWCCNYIWLHKQPLFMWQMALSMKIFGVSEFTIRYPDILMGTIMIWLVYRIAKLAVKNDFIAFTSAVFMCFSNYQLELTAGYQSVDHNDMAFGFYVLASIWAYVEYVNDKKWRWAILAGLFAGCAVLNKWLTGLIVFAPWGIYTLFLIKNGSFKVAVSHFLTAIMVALIVFLPWQLYIFHTFPAEAKFEYEYNTQHIFEVVERHGGDAWYYYDRFYLYFGKSIWWLLLAGMILTLVMRRYRNQFTLSLLGISLLAFSFFSFMVQSKMDSFVFVVAPLGYIFMAIAVGQLAAWLRNNKAAQLSFLLAGSYFMLWFAGIMVRHSPHDEYRQRKIYNTKVYKHARSDLPEGTNLVMNVPEFNDAEFMFYNKGITAFNYNLPQEIVDTLKIRGMKIAVFKQRSKYPVDDFIKNDPSIFIIDKELH